MEPVAWITQCEENKEEHTKKKKLPEQVQKLVIDAADNFFANEQRKVESLLKDFQDIFATTEADYKRTNIVQHGIDTADLIRIRQQPRRLPLAKRAKVDTPLKKMHEEGVIEPSNRPWASPG